MEMGAATPIDDDFDCCREDEDEDEDACAQECCSPPLKMGEGADGKIEREYEGGDVSVEDDDDSLCPCCIEILVQHPDAIGRTLIEAQSKDPLFPKNSDHRLSATIRKCCRLFKSFCSEKPCCLQPARLPKKGPAVAFAVPSTCKQPAEPVLVKHASDNLAHSSSGKSMGEPLKLEITGMGCADCCIKASRALSRLPSIKEVHLVYIDAVASFLYDPEVITATKASSAKSRSTPSASALAAFLLQPPSTLRPEDSELTRTPYGTARQVGTALYSMSPYLSHSCTPSARPSFSSGTAELHLIANRDLKKGEELSIAYMDVAQRAGESAAACRSRRRKELARGWRFACQCSRRSQWQLGLILPSSSSILTQSVTLILLVRSR
ncbi:hypothetical protein B0H11DRAFT_2308694 [Mycena galericulata]|nr:hypothetical protein B0H11DRAFT_2308694 [Mycena galericulata]